MLLRLLTGAAAAGSPTGPYRWMEVCSVTLWFRSVFAVNHGQNPTDIEVLDTINKIDNDTGGLDFQVL